MPHLNFPTLRAHIDSLIRWETHRDFQMPDPISHRDLLHLRNIQPPESQIERLLWVPYNSNPYAVTWKCEKPKGGVRLMAMTNPYSEIHLRTVLHPFGPPLHDAQFQRTYPGRLQFSRYGQDKPRAIHSQSMGKAYTDYRADLRLLVEKETKAAIASDIAGFYPSITPSHAARAYRPAVDLKGCTSVRLAYEKFQVNTGLKGLPIGPESSGWTSNRVLLQADLLLQIQCESQHVRWGDDYFIAGPDPEIVLEDFNTLREQLAIDELTISESKTRKSWEMGLTALELAELVVRDQPYINYMIDGGHSDYVEEMLIGELERQDPDKSLLNRLLGALAMRQPAGLKRSRTIVTLLLDNPSRWLFSCARVHSYLKNVSTSDERHQMIALAAALATDKAPREETVIQLIRAGTAQPDEFSDNTRRHLCQLLTVLSNGDKPIPLRGWARQGAFKMDADSISSRFIDTQEFDKLHPFEQRWAISFANPKRHHKWLVEQNRAGNWPVTAHWRAKSVN